MARKKVSRALAALPSRRALDKAHHKTEALTAILRDVAVKNQREQPRAFHSVRAVAAHFRVPTSTVMRAYRVLELEGLLSRIRGSKTILHGLHFDRQLKVRSFVGFPASVSRFVTLQDYRTFFIRIRRELRLANGRRTNRGRFDQPGRLSAPRPNLLRSRSETTSSPERVCAEYWLIAIARYKCVPVCEAGRGLRLRSFSAALAAALFGSGEGVGLVFTESRSVFEGGFGGLL